MESRRRFDGLHREDLGGVTVPAPIVELTLGAVLTWFDPGWVTLGQMLVFLVLNIR